MQKRDGMKVKGDVFLKRIEPNGNSVTIHVSNLVGNYGTALMATLLSGGANVQVNQIGLGTDATPETVTDTGLGAELYRKTASIALGTGADANKVTFESTWTAGAAAGTLREAGLFDDPAAGNLFSRTTFADLTIGPADTLIVTWVVSFVGT
jgi:hypothetical protein